METAVIDSSIWLSFLGGDSQYTKAEALLQKLKAAKALIFVPSFIYVEVINNVIKIDNERGDLLQRTKRIFQGDRDVRIIVPDGHFWLQKTEKYSKLVRLKTLDLLILAFAFEFHVHELYSFDKKLSGAYKTLKSKK